MSSDVKIHIPQDLIPHMFEFILAMAKAGAEVPNAPLNEIVVHHHNHEDGTVTHIPAHIDAQAIVDACTVAPADPPKPVCEN